MAQFELIMPKMGESVAEATITNWLKSEGDQIEEERRLAYVGITRAQRTLTMTSAAQRTQFGETSATTPSRFVDELPQDDLVRMGGNTEASAEQNQAAGEESLDALKSLFS